MEEKTSFPIMYSILGALAGALTGYLIGDAVGWKRMYADVDYTDEYEDEMDYHNDVPPKSHVTKSSIVPSKEVRAPVRNYKPKETIRKPSAEELVQRYLPTEEKTEPYIISEDMFRSADEYFPMYTADEIVYYEGDSVFADVEDNPIEDVYETLGANPHLHFGEGTDDQNTVYIASPRLGRIFEVTKVLESYATTVLGEEPPNKPAPAKKTPAKRNRVPKENDKSEK